MVERLEETKKDFLEKNEKEKIEPVVKIFLAHCERKNGDKSFCGPGMIRLLKAIRETGNVRQACERMDMSYSKGWKLLKTLELYLGFSVVVRRQGGRGGGEAFLTAEGLAFLEKHEAFLRDCVSAVTEIFNRYYL